MALFVRPYRPPRSFAAIERKAQNHPDLAAGGLHTIRPPARQAGNLTSQPDQPA
jgi:hypothetical protein